MVEFTPWSSLAGGALIGIGASLLLWFNGRIAGVSGMVNGVLNPARGDTLWRALFLLGLIVGAAAWFALAGRAFEPRTGFPVGLLVAGGFLVGFGTRMGSGCTSGHGVCGVARLSMRSIVATAIFVGTAILTTWVVRHVLQVTV